MTEEVKNRLINEYSKKFDFLDDNLDNLKIKGDIHLRHKECGTEYKTKLYIFLRESSKKYGCCPLCKNKKNSSHTDFLKKIKNKFGDEWEILSQYTGSDNKILVKHTLCNSKIYEIRAEDLLRKKPGEKCKYCSNRLTIDVIKKRIKNRINSDSYELLSDNYETNKTLLKFKHKECGKIFHMSALDFLGSDKRKPRGCPFCARNIKLTNDEFKEKFYSVANGNYELLSEYKGSDKKITVKHITCGNIYEVTARNFTGIHGNRCPKCCPVGHNTSYKEKEVAEYINSLGLEFEKNKRFYIEGKHYLEADILIETKKVIIEFDGLYWHSTTESTPFNLLEKTTFFNEKGYRVIHIFEDEWVNKKEIVKSKLKNILGLTKDKIYARKCEIREIDSESKKFFLEKYHIQGNDKSKIQLGLFYNNELVSVITFCKLRRVLGNKTNNGWELSRFASSKNVIGGFSKLLKHAIKLYNIDNIITYADLRWSSEEKNVYKTNGFILDHISKPGYFYIDKHKTERYHRYNFRKQVLKDKFPSIYSDNLTEKEIMLKAGYHILYDCGNLVYKL